MRVLTWNINAIRGIQDEKLEEIVRAICSRDIDVALLQEVGFVSDQPARLRAAFAKVGLTQFHLPSASNEKNYGSAIVTRGDLHAAPMAWSGAEWPQLLVKATVLLNGASFDVVSAHIPNGSGHGWKKIEHFEKLASALAELRGCRLILGGDFNEPRWEKPNGRWITWAEEPSGDGGFETWKTWSKGEITDTGSRWDKAVRSVLADEKLAGLSDALRKFRGSAAVEPTHFSHGQPRHFDHILYSEHFVVQHMQFEHEWREKKLSDHSAVWVELK